ncbi:MAG: preprotein translocase subunit YajC [Acidobacteria bacterium]|nr:preprotein translocase subunit YajC [Acidobacteriota bacterium]
MSHIPVLLLQGGAATLLQFLPIIAIFALFYFMILVPQRKRQAETQAMLDALKPNDKVVTSGGIVGLVTQVRDDSPRTVQLRICESPAVRIDVLRSSIASIYQENVSEKKA